MSHINGSPFSWRVRVFWLILNLSTGNREKIFHQRSQSGQFVFSFFCPVRVITVLVKGWRWPVSHFLCRWLASQTENGSTSKVCTMTEIRPRPLRHALEVNLEKFIKAGNDMWRRCWGQNEEARFELFITPSWMRPHVFRTYALLLLWLVHHSCSSIVCLIHGMKELTLV